MDKLIEEIKTTVQETMVEKEQELDINENIMETYELDSIDLAKILYDLEQKYNVSFSPREVSTLKTIKDYAELIKSKRDE